MEPETPTPTSETPPPEALLIRTAREAAGMTAAQAAGATKGAVSVSATYWRDVERGYGGRRGQRVPVRASDRLLAAMAHVTGVTPDQLAGAQRENAARVLTEILRRETGPIAVPPSLRPVGPYPAAESAKDEIGEEILAGLLSRYGDHEVVRAIGGQHWRDAGTRVIAILRFTKNPELDREVLASLLSRHPDDEAVQAIGNQRGKRELMRITEILEFLGWHPPEMGEAGNGTAG